MHTGIRTRTKAGAVDGLLALASSGGVLGMELRVPAAMEMLLSERTSDQGPEEPEQTKPEPGQSRIWYIPSKRKVFGGDATEFECLS